MNAQTRCANCGADPAHGFATLNGIRYCHGDDDSSATCYERMVALGVPESDVLVTMPEMRARLDAVIERAESARRVPKFSVRIFGSGRSWHGILHTGPMVAEATLSARSEKGIRRKADRWLAKQYARDEAEQTFTVTKSARAEGET